MPEKKPTLSPETIAAIHASSTCLCWKRAADMPPSLRVHQDYFHKTDPGNKPMKFWYTTVFPPAATPLRGVVVFLHGVNEHSERYFHVFQALCEMGFGVVAYDWRSHGKSDSDIPGLRYHLEQFQSVVDDTNDFITFVKGDVYAKMGVEGQQLPFVAMAMSLGTLITLHTVLSKKHAFDAVVLTSPAVSAEITWLLRLMMPLSPLLAALFPRSRLVPGVNAKFMARDPLVTADFDADPLTTRQNNTCRMSDQTLKAMKKVQQIKDVEDVNDSFCQIPILMIMGTHDKVTSQSEATKFYNRIATKDKNFEWIDGAYHVIFEDFERAKIMAILQNWLQTRFEVNK